MQIALFMRISGHKKAGEKSRLPNNYAPNI